MVIFESKSGIHQLDLTDRQWEVCKLRYAYRYTQAEIAVMLGICQQRVSQHLTVARERYPHMPRLLTDGRHRRRLVPLDSVYIQSHPAVA